MGDVLYDATLWRRWLLRLLQRMGLHTQYRTFFKIWDVEFLNEVHCGRREYSEAFQAFLLSAGLSRGQIDEVEAARQARIGGQGAAFPWRASHARPVARRGHCAGRGERFGKYGRGIASAAGRLRDWPLFLGDCLLDRPGADEARPSLLPDG